MILDARIITKSRITYTNIKSALNNAIENNVPVKYTIGHVYDGEFEFNIIFDDEEPIFSDIIHLIENDHNGEADHKMYKDVHKFAEEKIDARNRDREKQREIAQDEINAEFHEEITKQLTEHVLFDGVQRENYIDATHELSKLERRLNIIHTYLASKGMEHTEKNIKDNVNARRSTPKSTRVRA